MGVSERVRVAVVSVVCTWLFFFEYIPPLKRVHFWSDIEGYHYPLLNYAFQSLKQGRFPLWDPSMYSGVSFVGNVQAGLFYPPNWLLFAADAGRPALLYTHIEMLGFAHVWLAFFGAYLWLRGRCSHWLPAVLGACVAALSGYVMSQFNHLGVICGYAWIPPALWAVDQASRSRRWKPLWKVSAAATMTLLAGYPSTWAAFGIITAVYAATLPGRLWLLPQTIGAVALSLVLGAVQLLPALEAARLKISERNYGGPMPDLPYFYLSFLLPNYYDGSRLTDGPDLSRGDYFYLGVPALFGVLWLVRNPRLRGAVSALSVLAVCWVIIQNPQAKLEMVVNRLPLVPDVLRSYNLLIAFSLAGSLLAASAIDDFLTRAAKRVLPKRVRVAWIIATVTWCVYLVVLWRARKSGFVSGVGSAMYPAVLLALMWLGLAIHRSKASVLVAGLLVLAVFVDYKVFGTSRRFSAMSGNSDDFWQGDARIGGPSFRGLSDATYQTLQRRPWYRTALVEGPQPTDLRHYHLNTPQGFDPFITRQYREAVERFVPFRTNRLFDMNPLDEDFLRSFGVGYVLAREGSDGEKAMLADRRYRRLDPAASFYQVYEIPEPQPAWRLNGKATVVHWSPERRQWRVEDASGGPFTFLEQWWPGWHASVDGKAAAIRRCEVTFQCIDIPSGTHTIEFAYRPASVMIGALVSSAAWLALWLVARRRL